MTKRRLRSAMTPTAAVLILLFGACASTEAESLAESPSTSVSTPIEPDLSPCDNEIQQEAVDVLNLVEQWWRIDSADVEEILGRDDLPPGFGGNPAEFKFEGSRTAGPDSATPILLADAFVAPALDLANDSQTSVHAAARAGGLIMFVLVENPDGQLALGGSCANQILGDAIQRTADPEATLRSLPTKASEELSAVLDNS